MSKPCLCHAASYKERSHCLFSSSQPVIWYQEGLFTSIGTNLGAVIASFLFGVLLLFISASKWSLLKCSMVFDHMNFHLSLIIAPISVINWSIIYFSYRSEHHFSHWIIRKNRRCPSFSYLQNSILSFYSHLAASICVDVL